MSAIQSIKNFYAPVSSQGIQSNVLGGKNMKKNLGYFISPVTFARIRNDIQIWRDSIGEAEQAWYPHRVKMQRIFQDTILNEHVEACMKRRKRLTLLRDFKLCTTNGKEDQKLKPLFDAKWFADFQNYALDALFFGYSLIAMGDVVNDSFPDLSVIRRQNVSPDRENVTSLIYSLSGQPFNEDPFKTWHVWVPTPSELGVSKCGYGLFYKIAKTEIYLRNNTAFNADAIELFGQPLRKGKTTKTEEAERASFENAMKTMGSSGWILLDEGQDELELVEAKGLGSSYQIYGDFEKRNQQKISKVLLGHADAMDSVPGKLGAGQGEGESPVQEAMDEIQMEDGTFMQNIINNSLLPRMRLMGFNIPEELHFEYENNREVEEARRKEDVANEQTATIAQLMTQGGMNMDPAYFTKRTGIPATKVEKPAPIMPGKTDDPNDKMDPKLKEKTKNKLKLLYRER